MTTRTKEQVMNHTQKSVITVLERMIFQVRRGADDAQVYAEVLEQILDELHGNDFFGTEGQCDPRGDFRDGDWSMTNVQGVEQ